MAAEMLMYKQKIFVLWDSCTISYRWVEQSFIFYIFKYTEITKFKFTALYLFL